MEGLKIILILLLVVVVAVFTGTWIFNALSWFLDFLSDLFCDLSKIFDLFGWNNGIL